ncbi:MAG: hypothetical protein RBS80_05235 [Thermoguttaceae bacterium]|nr:hypothetical protein [Thermoguttaceae bacterium]
MINPPDLIEAVTPVVRLLESFEIPYYVGGSVASCVYGFPRSTLDVDLVADLAMRHVEPLVEALRDQYYVDGSMIRDAIRRRACFNVIYLPTHFKVDVFVLGNRAYDRTTIQRRRSKAIDQQVPDVLFPLPSPEDVILAKLQWYRLGDEISERQWTDVVGVMKVQHNALQREYLDQWAAELGVADLLARAWAEVEPQ